MLETPPVPLVTEVMDARHLEKVVACADILQIGSHNMQNFTLLEAVGRRIGAAIDGDLRATECAS